MDDALVLAMPRRELFRISGFTKQVDLEILHSLAEDSWYAAPASLVGNFDAKEVRLGLVVMRSQEGTDHLLIDAHGVALHATPIPPEVGHLGPGLAALRQLALVAGRTMLGISAGTVELIGYCNDDTLPECRPFFLLVYRMKVAADVAAPAGMTWVARSALANVPLDPVSALVAAGI
ncbi:MAG: hypothetical protein H0W78_09955 [Planctomycetes bacterium]|nr:hypothetical protein [Planctomycetota bacterium]